MRTRIPEAEPSRLRTPREQAKSRREAASLVVVEVRGGDAFGDEPHVHVEPVTDTDHVAQQTPVAVNAVRGRVGEQAHASAGREKLLRPLRRRTPVALCAEVHLGGVDLHEADALPVPKRDRVSVGDVIDAEHWRGSGGVRGGGERSDSDDGDDGRDPHRTRSRSASLPLLPQSTVTGQLPACVEEPTFHDQVIRVPVFAPSPFACDTVVS